MTRLANGRGACSIVAAGALVLAAASLAAQAQRPAPQATFRGGVELVAVDFIAVTADGRPVTDLRPGDLKLTVDGRTRSVQELQFIQLADDTDVAATPAKQLPLPFGTNKSGEAGRNVIFLFDDNTIRPGNERAAKAAASKFLDRLAPADRVALATTGRVEVDLTTDHARVRAALANVMGHGAAGASHRPTGGAIDMTGGPKMAWLRTFLLGLKDIDGPKTVLLIAESAPAISTADVGIGLDYREVAKAAGAVRAQLYVIQPHNFSTDASQTASDVGMSSDASFGPTSWTTGGGSEGLGDLASISGGELYRLSGAGEDVFQRILRQSAAYYLLGFAPDESERNGKSHHIEISVARPGVTVRARPEFTIPRVEPAVTAAGPTVAKMLGDTKTYREVALRTAVFTARPAPKGQVSLVIVVEAVDSTTPLEQVALGLIDTRSRRMASAGPAGPSEITGARVLAGRTVPPGTYRLRVSALTKDGRRGAAEYEFVAGMTPAKPIEVSDLMIGQGLPDGTFEPQLTFGDRPAATGYLELRGSLPKGTAVSVAFELASTVDGPALLTAPGIVGPTASADRWTARGAIPIGNVPAGDYVARAIVKVDGATVARIVRAVRKVK